MKTSHLAALTVATLFSPAAVSAQAAATETPAPAAAAPATTSPTRSTVHNPDQVICKHEEETGTRLGGHRTCHTRAEWDNIAHNGRDMIDAIQYQNNGVATLGH